MRTLRGQAADARKRYTIEFLDEYYDALARRAVEKHPPSDPLKEADAALKALREAKDQEGRRRATEALEKALEKLKQQAKPEGKPGADPKRP